MVQNPRPIRIFLFSFALPIPSLSETQLKFNNTKTQAMGFAIGSSHTLLQNHYHYPSSSSSMSSFASNSHLIFSYGKNYNVETKRRKMPSVVTCTRQDDPSDIVFSKKRAVLLVGISVLPFLQLRARALETLVTSESELKALDNQKPELAIQKYTPPNPFLSLLNGLGIFSTGVLGAFYALATKEKKATEATLEYMTAQLKDKDAAIVSLAKNFEAKLLNEQEERRKQLGKAKEEQQILVNQLSSANSTITGLGQELKNEKRIIEGLNVQKDGLEINLSKAIEEKRYLEQELKEKLNFVEVLQDKINLLSLELKDKENDVQNLSSSVAEKELEMKNLNFTYKETKEELEKAHKEIEVLIDEVLEIKKELELKKSAVDELNSAVSSLTFARDESNRKLAASQAEYNALKSSSEQAVSANAKLLREREDEIDQLEAKLKRALNEVSGNQGIITTLTQEREDLRKVLEAEVNQVMNLKHELQSTREALEKFRNEASDLAKELEQSKYRCTELEAEVSRAQAEFTEVIEMTQKSLQEAKRSGEVLSGELIAVKEQLKKSKEDLQIMSVELATVTENHASVQKELVDAYNKVEVTANELREDKKVVSSLNEELENLEKQMLKDREARKSMEIDLEDATKSLDEMNRNALMLSGELEIANSRISSLEDDKQVLYKSLTEHKYASKEAQENMEDAHNMVLRLGQERESLEKKAKKLEEGLASAKGEILRLRSQINSSKTVPKINSSKAVPNEQHSETGEAEENVTVAAKRTRRRKTGTQ
ncbi:MAR-binding filament-like protein 1-1 [Euphorbia lathyris]|uniref:MAR-binding filament-like protein 1-1 n=1 Tax=Euphorbia lathyris TaxID=212925 RepID=UPI0033143D76